MAVMQISTAGMAGSGRSTMSLLLFDKQLTMAEQNEFIIDPPIDLSLFYNEREKPKEKVQPTVWKEDEDLTNSFHELSSNNPVNLKENVEIIPMNQNLLNDSSASSHLVTRQEQRAVIKWAFKESRENLSERRFIAAIRGSPGIDKSWSALLYPNEDSSLRFVGRLELARVGRRC
jgi:hypothetical protein